MKKSIFILMILFCGVAAVNAQFPIKIPKVKIPKVETKPNQPSQPTDSKPNQPSQPNGSTPIQPSQPTGSTQNTDSSGNENNNITRQSGNRQMVMDDGVTFFDAEPVEGRNAQNTGRIDVGWYLKSTLRILGTFPKRSAFKISVKKNGKELATNRCEGTVYSKANNPSMGNTQRRTGRDLDFEDYMVSGYRCFDEKAVVKEIGEMDVEIYFIDGDSNAEKLVRKHKIDVRKATKVRGNASAPEADISDYYIQRHAEAAVAIAHLLETYSYAKGYFSSPIDIFNPPISTQLIIHTTYSPSEQNKYLSNPFVRCSVNGTKINFTNDQVRVSDNQDRMEVATYTDHIGAKFKSGPPYRDRVRFVGLNFSLPIFTGKTPVPNPIKLEDYQGKWECSIIENGVTFRTFRWEVGSDGIIPHAEQKNNNINLFYNAALIEMEIPPGGGVLDFRLLPLPNAGLFYGIPWTSSEGKAMAARVPKLGNPYHVPSK